MAYVAYYGHPGTRVFGRVTFSSEHHALISCWNNSSYYGLHDTEKEETHWDRVWNSIDGPLQHELFGAPNDR